MEKWRVKVAIVTGASSGIGANVTKALVNAGLTVVDVARRDNKIEVRSTNCNEFIKHLFDETYFYCCYMKFYFIYRN